MIEHYTYTETTDDTVDVEDGIVYIWNNNGTEWLATLNCPCGCGNKLQLILLKNEKPSWSIIKHDNKGITFTPSIHKTSGCKSHFFIREGRVIWC
jgi:hypothetical protein